MAKTPELDWPEGQEGMPSPGRQATTYVPACASLVMGSGSPIGSSPFVELLKNGVSGWPKLQSASKGVSGAIKPKLTEASAQLAPLPQVATPVATTRTGTLVMDLGGVAPGFCTTSTWNWVSAVSPMSRKSSWLGAAGPSIENEPSTSSLFAPATRE